MTAGALAAVLATTPGCWLVAGAAGAAAAGTGVAYAMGDLEGVLEADLDEAIQATEQALRSQGLDPSSRAKTSMDAQFESTTAYGDDVTVTLEEESANRTHISIRVGTMGDEDKSRRIYDAILAELGGSSATGDHSTFDDDSAHYDETHDLGDGVHEIPLDHGDATYDDTSEDDDFESGDG